MSSKTLHTVQTDGLLQFRQELKPNDGDAVRTLAETTGFFFPEEIDIAVELVKSASQRGHQVVIASGSPRSMDRWPGTLVLGLSHVQNRVLISTGSLYETNCEGMVSGKNFSSCVMIP